ncbi:MAG: hypothetical protein ABI442_10230 [Gemmatimonadaceae bacterium]
MFRGPTAARIYAYNNENTEFGFRSVLVATDGLHEETVKGGLISGVDIAYSGGFVFATTVEVVDVAALQEVGTIPASGLVRSDETRGRVQNGVLRNRRTRPRRRSKHRFASRRIGRSVTYADHRTNGLVHGLVAERHCPSLRG